TLVQSLSALSQTTPPRYTAASAILTISLRELQRLQILNHGAPLRLGQVVAKTVPGVALARQSCVVDSPPLLGRQFRVRWAVQGSNLQADALGVVVFLLRAVASRKDLGACPGIQHVINRGHRGVVEVRGRGPDPVERRGLVAGGFGHRGPAAVDVLLLGEPGLVEDL